MIEESDIDQEDHRSDDEKDHYPHNDPVSPLLPWFLDKSGRNWIEAVFEVVDGQFFNIEPKEFIANI